MQTADYPDRVLDALDAAAIRRWCDEALAAMQASRDHIDALNVYPVPDGDTGTNLVLTLQAATQAVRGAPDELPAALGAMAQGALLGARGNSGVIVSQLLRGLADVLPAGAGEPGDALSCALERATQLCYAAVAEPVEGTILTVARAAAEAARRRCGGEPAADLDAVMSAAAAAARVALASTPDLLPILARAGVVDAGGAGLCVLLDALAGVIREEKLPFDPSDRATTVLAGVGWPEVGHRETGSSAYGYEVQYLVEGDAEPVADLKFRLGELGDSLVVVGGADRLWKVHVHVNDVGAAIEAGCDAGRLRDISVTRFADDPAIEDAQTPPSARAVVAVTIPGGTSALFDSAGAVVVTARRHPSTAELLAAMRRRGAAEVVLLPNDPDVRATAEAAAAVARAEGVTVAVIPTRSPVQGLAALAVHDPDAPFADDVVTMTAAAGATRPAAVTRAVRTAQTSAGICRAGDVLGMLDGDVAVIGESVVEVASELLDRALGAGGELVTVLIGVDAPTGVGELLCDRAPRRWPGVEMTVYDGGQPHFALLLGVE